MVTSPKHQLLIRRSRVPDLRPMHSLMAGCLEKKNPFGREIHIDQKAQHHFRTRASSRSSNRQAA